MFPRSGLSPKNQSGGLAQGEHPPIERNRACKFANQPHCQLMTFNGKIQTLKDAIACTAAERRALTCAIVGLRNKAYASKEYFEAPATGQQTKAFQLEGMTMKFLSAKTKTKALAIPSSLDRVIQCSMSLIALLFLIQVFSLTPTFAQDVTDVEQAAEQNEEAESTGEPLVKKGDLAVTGFSGTVLPEGGLKPGVDPIDATFIDPEGTALRVIDLSNLGKPKNGKGADVSTVLQKKANEIGQVFGVTLDKPDEGMAPNIYVGATSLYGLQISTDRDGKPMRLVNGEPGAQWMSGQFGNGGGPGSIWKIDGRTGEASLFTNISSGPNENAGPGLGALAYDMVSQSLYVPNLETGYIHQVNKDGESVAIYDHGTQGRIKAELEAVAYDHSKRMSIDHPSFSVEDPSTWGFTSNDRLIVAVAVENNRLYYSVAEGPEIWSVGLDENGGFIDDARPEFSLAGTATGNTITGITFDGPNDIYLTQRGPIAASYDFGTLAFPSTSSVLHFSWDEDNQTWTDKTEEFPISFKTPHRATNGGIGLGYGYNKRGKIKTGKCNATLWTTGDNLNNPEVVDQAINGVQGMSKSLGQAREAAQSDAAAAAEGLPPEDLPPLESPSEGWLVDYDSKNFGDDEFGHIGSLAIYTPDCENDGKADDRPDVVADADPGYVWPEPDPEFGPTGWIPPPPPGPIGTPGLEITKECAPAAVGGVMQCTITVTNTGTLPLTDPIIVTDNSIIAAGPAAGGSLQIVAVTPDGPEWTCAPPPATPDLTCGLPPEHLPPGTSRSFVVDIDTSAMLANGNVGFMNCASLGAPYTGQACDNGGAAITVKKTAQNPNCTAGLPCTFTIEFANNSDTDFNGNVQLTDLPFMTAGVGILPPSSVTFAPPLGCNGGDPANVPFTCQAPMSLAAGATQSHTVTVTLPPAPPNNYWIRNCMAITAPGTIPNATTMQQMVEGGAMGGTLGTGAAMSCAWVAVGAPPPASNLKIQKTSDGKCTKDPADETNVQCDFTIAITNTGPSPFSGSINIEEQAGFGSSTVVSNDPAWVVSGPAPPGTFALNNDPVTNPVVNIAASDTITIPVSVFTPKTDVEAPGNFCDVKNTATILSPVWPPSLSNFNSNDDQDFANGNASLLEFDENGAAVILCDPTNLQTTKISKGPCVKSGDKWRCEYEVNVLNTGPDPYKGKIILDDVLSIAATNVSIAGGSDPRWVKSGTGSNFKFEIPWTLADGTTLEKDQSAKLNLTVEIPDGEYCSLTNTATMSFPVLKRHNDNPNDDTGEATSKIPRPECDKKPQCTPKDGEFRTTSGACACKRNYTRDNDGKCVPDVPETDTTAELKLEKSCKPDGDLSNYRCRLTVRNNGTGSYNGRITLNDETTDLSSNAPIRITHVNADTASDWNCGATPADSVSCWIDGSKVGPGQSRHIDVSVTLDSDDQAFKNCVEGNSSGTAGVHTFDNVCVEIGKTTETPQDETGELKVEKTGPAECVGGVSCEFTFTFTNVGNGPINGQSAIVDGITGDGNAVVNGAQIVSITPPLGCATEPGHLPFGCTTNLNLAPGQSQTHKVVVKIPEGTQGEKGTSMTNCVMVNEPGVLDADVDEMVPNMSTAQPTTPAGQRTACHTFTTTPPQDDLCKRGMVLIDYGPNKGECGCPEGTTWSGRACVGDDAPTDPEEPTCPDGMDQFREFKGKPLGYELRYVTSHGERLICGEPTCDNGWEIFRDADEIPQGWDRKKIGRPNSKYKFYCARPDDDTPPPPGPGPECWSTWETISYRERSSYKRNGYKVTSRSKNGKTVWCAKKTDVPTKGPYCWEDWITIKYSQQQSYKDKGYRVTSRSKHGKTVWCAKKTDVPLYCWRRWETISVSQIPIYRGRGYNVKPRSKHGKTVWCAQKIFDPPIDDVPPTGTPVVPETPICRGPNEVLDDGECVCRTGYHRNNYDVCVRVVVDPPPGPSDSLVPGGTGDPQPCPGRQVRQPNGLCACRPGDEFCTPYVPPRGDDAQPPSTRVTCSGGGTPVYHAPTGLWACKCPSGKRPVKAGANHYRCVSSGGNGSVDDIGNCLPPRFKNKAGHCTCGRNKRWTGSTCVPKGDKTCKQIGKVGKWPNCKDKPKKRCKDIGKVGKWPNCKDKPKKRCKDIGKVGKWPNCKDKPKKRCKDIGKVGKWPNCKDKPKKRCKDIGKVGKWPNCKDKPKKRCKDIGKVGKWPNCKNKPKKTCKQIGKVGKWPNCKNKPKKRCKDIGKVGKWPNCKDKPKKRCKDIGKVGKWPNCRNKPAANNNNNNKNSNALRAGQNRSNGRRNGNRRRGRGRRAGL